MDIRNPMAADPAYIARLFHIESGGNPNAVTGSNRGLGQFGPMEESRYGLGDHNRGDYGAQAAAIGREYAEHYPILQKALGRAPSPGEMYLTHQQGVAGGPALLTSDPGVPAWQAIRPFYKNDAIARQAITGNIPRGHDLYGRDPDQVTAGDFTRLWTGRFDGQAVAPGSAAQTAPVPSLGGSPGVPDASPAPSVPSVQGMIDPNDSAYRMFEKFGGGRGMLNGQQQGESPPPPMMRLQRGTPAAQAIRQSLMANILQRK